MLIVSDIRENLDNFINGLKKKKFTDAETVLPKVISLDDERKATQGELDQVLNDSKTKAKAIGQLMKEGKKEEAEAAKKATGELKEKSRQLSEKLESIQQALTDILYTIPNVPHPSVPEGGSDEDNEVVHQHGDTIKLPDDALPHWELAKKYDIIDFELGNKITGAGFPVYKGKGAKLQRALIQFFLDEAGQEGYTEVQPPIIINQQSGLATGQLPDKEGQMYGIVDSEFYLIPTAEVPITNLYRDVILKEEELPVKNVGYTPCFRREAGSWGAHVRGLNRLHQFDKVEIVQITHPDQSYGTLEAMASYVQRLMEKLELPYRKLRLCGGDIGFTSALTFDMEVYSAGQQRWLEVSSVSNFETYQANRLKLRFKENGKNRLLHTLNGSALALPRILAALLENNQQADGITIPEVLVPYTKFERI